MSATTTPATRPKSPVRAPAPPNQVRAAPHSMVSVTVRHGLDVPALRNKAKADPQGYVEVLRDLVDRRAEHDRKVKLGEYSGDREAAAFSFRSFERDVPGGLRGLREALDPVVVEVVDPNDRARAAMVQTSAFALATNTLVVAGVNEAYMDVNPIEDRLVRRMPTNKKLSAFVGVLTTADKDDNVETAEGEDFPLIGAKEEEYWCRTRRYGFQTTLSQELFEENDVPQITSRITDLGFLMRRKRRFRILKRVTDHDGSAASGAEPYVLHGPGVSTGRALFGTNNNSPLTRLPSTGNRLTNNALNDATDVENARIRLAAMTHSDGHRIEIPREELVCLVPNALWLTAWQIFTSAMEPGVFNAVNFFGPNGPAGPGMGGLLTNPMLDDLSASAWYYGAPRLQFTLAEKLPVEVATFGGPNTEAFVSARQALRVRIACEDEVCATDYVYWLQNLSGTTAPKDE